MAMACAWAQCSYAFFLLLELGLHLLQHERVVEPHLDAGCGVVFGESGRVFPPGKVARICE
jgi:hypothetical protein